MQILRRLQTALQRSLRLKVSLGIVLPLLLILGFFTYLEYDRLNQAMLNNLSLVASQSGQLVEKNLRQQMLNMDFAGMQQMLDTIGQGIASQTSVQFRVIYLLDITGKVKFAPLGKGVGETLSNTRPDCQPCHKLSAADRPGSIIVTTPDDERVFRSMNPILNGPECIRCHDPAQRIIGLLLLDVPTAPLEGAIAVQLREHLVWWLVTILVVMLVVNLALSHFVLHRLEGFSTTLRDKSSAEALPILPIQNEDEIDQLAQAFNQMARQVEVRQAENISLSESLQRQSQQRGELLKRLIQAQEDERKRLARELHDELGQALSGLALHAEAALRFLSADPNQTQSQLIETKKMIQETTNQMYELILALRPSVLDDLGLATALRMIAERLLTSARIEYTIDDHLLTDRLPREIEISLYRTFQEALNNIIRHARATKVEIELARNEQGFNGKISDNGVGFDPSELQTEEGDQRRKLTRGLGLLGMQERISQCGGVFHLESSPGCGTTIEIHIPLAPEHE